MVYHDMSSCLQAELIINLCTLLRCGSDRLFVSNYFTASFTGCLSQNWYTSGLCQSLLFICQFVPPEAFVYWFNNIPTDLGITYWDF